MTRCPHGKPFGTRCTCCLIAHQQFHVEGAKLRLKEATAKLEALKAERRAEKAGERVAA